LDEYDYSSPGAYFVTVVTYNHLCILGKVILKVMHPNALGRISQDCWQEIPVHFPDIKIEPFIIMLNHIHGILSIHENNRSRGKIYRTPTSEKFSKPVVGSIPTIIRTYKGAVSR
jgi:REP element-mobilizing transposase RayT